MTASEDLIAARTLDAAQNAARTIPVRLHWTARSGWGETCHVYRFEVLVSLYHKGRRKWVVDGVLALDGFPPESLPLNDMGDGKRGRGSLAGILTRHVRHDLDCEGIAVELHHLVEAYEAMREGA